MFFPEAQKRHLGLSQRCSFRVVSVHLPTFRFLTPKHWDLSKRRELLTQRHRMTSQKAGMSNAMEQAETRAGDAKTNNSVTLSFALAQFLHHLKSVLVWSIALKFNRPAFKGSLTFVHHQRLAQACSNLCTRQNTGSFNNNNNNNNIY
jgi:hypothetical protein